MWIIQNFKYKQMVSRIAVVEVLLGIEFICKCMCNK